MTRRYDIETGKSDAEILTPRGQDLASTFKKLCLPSSRCPISSRGRVLAEIPSGSSDKSDDRSSKEFTRYEQEMLAEILRNSNKTRNRDFQGISQKREEVNERLCHKLCHETRSILN